MLRYVLIAMLAGCAADLDDTCFDDDDRPIACEPLTDDSVLVEAPEPPEPMPVDTAPSPPGPDDLDGLADESIDVAPEDYAPLPAMGPAASTAIDWGRTDRAERRKFLPIGRTAGVTRFVVMRLRPSDLPALRSGDTLRAAAELQVTTRCDIGQVAPGCNYSPRVRMQLVLSGDPDGTNPHGAGTVALSGVEKFECSKDDHHCVRVIAFTNTAIRDGMAPCLADDSCFVNLVAWAYHPDARSGGDDKLLLGANEGDFLQNGDIEQDRGRIMAVRERGLGADDVGMRVTDHTVKHDPITLSSNGQEHRIYSHTVAGGRDLHAGEKFRVWSLVDASSNGRVNLSIEMFLTKDRFDANGGGVADTSPKAISEHDGTNCSPGNDCHLRKVAVFAVDRELQGPVYINIAASTEVPGPGSATTTIHDSGFVKVVHYAR